MEDYQIIITREKAFFGCALKHSVEVDGLSVGVLENGKTLVVHTAPGQHTISFIKGKGIEKNISITVDPEQYTTHLLARLNNRQKIEITRSNAQPLANGFAQDANPRRRKRHPVLKTIGIAFLITIALGVIANLGEDGTAPNDNPPAEEKPVELTSEEKAAIQLEAATAEFQDSDYEAALKICDEIVSEYPDTEVALNMATYISEQYEQFPHFSAKDLMSEYDANIVNADEEYTDVVMVVSGTVAAIGKTNSDTNLTVMLNSGVYFYGVQLNFKTSQTDAVAALSEGDSVSAIGKCTGKSGKHLLVLDGDNVMIENCYLID